MQKVERADAHELPEATSARYWLGLAVAVLILAGLFALVVVIGRMPPFDRLVTDPLFFKRGLVVHVNLSLVAWFYSFVAAMLFMLPGRSAPGWLARHSAHLSAAGVGMLLLASGLLVLLALDSATNRAVAGELDPQPVQTDRSMGD